MVEQTCTRCGAGLGVRVKFCAACGAPTSDHPRERRDEIVERRTTGRRVIGAVACVYAGTLAGLALAVVLSFGSDDGGITDAGFWVLAAAEVLVGLGAVAILGTGALRGSLAARPAWRSWWWGAVVGLGTFAMSWLYVAALSALLGWNSDAEAWSTVLILHVVVVAPVVEEWLCRGVLWDALRRVTSWRTTLVMTSVLFGLLHCLGGIVGFPHRFVTGLAFGWLRHATGSLLPGIIAHVVNNALAVGLG